MISLISSGEYRLIETKADTKMLTLDGSTFAWINAKGIGEILVASHREHETDAILSVGNFKLYDVKGEANVTDLEHLELEAGENVWQSYLLLTGLPGKEKKRARIIPTKDLITGKKRFTRQSRKRTKLPLHLFDATNDEKKEDGFINE